MLRPLLAPVLAASLAVSGCAGLKQTVEANNPLGAGGTLDITNIDVGRIISRAIAFASKACAIRPIEASIGPIVANIISEALGLGGLGLTIEQAAQRAGTIFCDFANKSAAAVGARRGAATGPVNFGTLTIGGKDIQIIGTPLGAP
jgi:hypothetical protein